MNVEINSWTDRQLQSVLRQVLETIHDAVTIVDTEGIVQYWNRVSEETYGIMKEQIIGKRIGDFFQRESIMLIQVMESGLEVKQVYHEPRSGMHVIIDASPIRDSEGTLLGAIAIEHNVTQYVKMSAEMYTKQEEEELSSASFPFKPEVLQAAKLCVHKGQALLLLGENGVGRRAIAKWIHQELAHEGAFVTVSCSTIPEGLMEAELFGYEGEEVRQGKLDQAKNGLLYLKDIHLMPLYVQNKLAEAIQERSYTRLAGKMQVKLQCAIICAIPSESVVLSSLEDGTLLDSLYYMMFQQRIPSLSDRKQDLPELSRMIVEEAAGKLDMKAPLLTSDALAAIQAFNWPGNLPQLKHAIEHACFHVHASGQGQITALELPDYARLTTLAELTEGELPLSMHSEEMERGRILEALKRTNGNKARAARLLSISRGALYYKLRSYGIEDQP
ncbi:sigma 54-interacting transcriptional regulator [Paenibacillus sp. 1001270B_150601_E10]|uniref:sigma 54-interacting transcriptional regulator n=1 Tax=Paenibacillus sp. 1001270B_150601_E10 TaxID=2787079 RepID=UPI00189CBC63|nr:sigma 54-interacting transcriptional regulator [Paenibacillus sp. 1001270B_150601_E10]